MKLKKIQVFNTKTHPQQEPKNFSSTYLEEKRLTNSISSLLSSPETSAKALQPLQKLKSLLQKEPHSSPFVVPCFEVRDTDLFLLILSYFQNFIRVACSLRDLQEVQLYHDELHASLENVDATGHLGDWLNQLLLFDSSLVGPQYVTSGKLLLRIAFKAKRSHLYTTAVQWLAQGQCSLHEICHILATCPVPSPGSLQIQVIKILAAHPHFDAYKKTIFQVVLHWCESLSHELGIWIANHLHDIFSLYKFDLEKQIAWHSIVCRQALLAGNFDLLLTTLSHFLNMLKANQSEGDPWAFFAPPSKPLNDSKNSAIPSPHASLNLSAKENPEALLVLRLITIFVQEMVNFTNVVDTEDFNNPYNSSYMRVKELLHEILHHLVERYFPIASRSIKLARSLFEWLLSLALLLTRYEEHPESSVSCINKATSLLSILENPGERAALLPSLLRASHLLYQCAIQLKANHAYSKALLPSKHSVEALRLYIANDTASTSKSLLYVTLAKRLELLATLSILLNQSDSTEPLVEALNLLLLHDRTHVDSFILRHVQRDLLQGNPTPVLLSGYFSSPRVFYAEWKALYRSAVKFQMDVLELWRSSLSQNYASLQSLRLASSEDKSSIQYFAKQQTYNIQYAQFLNCSAISNVEYTPQALSHCEEAIGLLNQVDSSLHPWDTSLDTEWLSYKLDFLAMLYCFKAFFSNNLDLLSVSFHLFKSISNDPHQTFFSKDDTCWQLSILENLLLTQSRYSQLVLLYDVKLLLASDESQKADIFVQMARIYWEMGYQGPSIVCLTNAKEQKGNSPLWQGAYACYLASLGNLPKSEKILDSVETKLDDLSTCFLELSWIQLKSLQGCSSEALQRALRCSRIAKKAGHKWILLQSLYWVASLYFIIGLSNDSDAYAQQGLHLARQLHNAPMESKFRLLLAKLLFFRARTSECKEMLDPDATMAQSISGSKEHIQHILFLGTVLLCGGSQRLQDSVQHLAESAKDYILKLKGAKPPWIQGIEQASPRTQRLLMFTSKSAEKPTSLLVNVAQLELELILLHSELLRFKSQGVKAETLLMRSLDQGHLFGPIKPLFYLKMVQTILDNLEERFPEHPRLVVLQDAVQVIQSTSDLHSKDELLEWTSTESRMSPPKLEEALDNVASKISFCEGALLEIVKDLDQATLPSHLLEIGHLLIYLQAIKSLLHLPTLPVPLILELCCHGVTYKRLERISFRSCATGGPSMIPSQSIFQKNPSQIKMDFSLGLLNGSSTRIDTSVQVNSNEIEECKEIDVLKEEPLNSSVHTLTLMEPPLKPSLPSNWCICRLSLDRRGKCLVLSAKHDMDLVTLRLPISRFDLRAGKDMTPDYLDAQLEAFHDLITKNDTMLQKSYVTPEDKQRWWTERNDLNQSLFHWLLKVERNWFGSFRGLLACHHHPEASVFLDTLSQFFQNQFKVSVTLEIPILIIHSWMSLSPDLSDSDYEDIGYFLLDELQHKGVAVEGEFLDPLILFLRSTLSRYDHNDLIKCQHTVFILDKHLCDIPLESMPVLHRHSVSRVFSMQMLESLIRGGIPAIHPDSVYYLLNPSGDLRVTEETLTPYMTRRQSWNGCIGSTPTESEFLQNLASHDLFLYFGHGGAENICSPKRFQGVQLPVTFLMGCSSGKLHSQGEFEPMGTVINYVTARASCLVANLWDVTDKDIDRFACSALRQFGVFDKEDTFNFDLSTAVASARDDCRFRYLIGAAPVVFGLPVNLIA